jgi:hypothetical protein
VNARRETLGRALSPAEQTIARKLRLGALGRAESGAPAGRAGALPSAAAFNWRDPGEPDPGDRQTSGPEEGGP